MPELPEVETMCRGIAQVVGARIRDAELPQSHVRPIRVRPRGAAFRRRLVGQQIAGISRVGKRVVLQLAAGDRIVFEPRMTGLVLLSDPPTTAHLRLRLHLCDAAAGELLFWDRRGLGSVQVVSPAGFNRAFGPQRLGPDALVLSAQQLAQALQTSRREIKVALLDQHAVAGIGNLYASEILHVAAVHPQRRCCHMTRREWRNVHAAMQHVLAEAIRLEGSTLSDGTYRNALNQAGRYQNHHRVYDRAGQSCPRCEAGVIRRIIQAGRSTFYCPVCQTKRAARVRLCLNTDAPHPNPLPQAGEGRT